MLSATTRCSHPPFRWSTISLSLVCLTFCWACSDGGELSETTDSEDTWRPGTTPIIGTTTVGTTTSDTSTLPGSTTDDSSELPDSTTEELDSTRGDLDDVPETVLCDTPTVAEICETYECIDLCGATLAQLPAPSTVATGVANYRSEEFVRVGELVLRNDGTRLTVQNAGETLATVENAGVIVAATSELALTSLRPDAYGSYALYDIGVPAAPTLLGHWNFVDGPTPIPEWSPGRVLGRVGDDFLLSTPRGIARVDVSDPLRPTTQACWTLPATDDGQLHEFVDATDAHLLIRRSSGEASERDELSIFELRDENSPPRRVTLDMQFDGSVALDGSRLLLQTESDVLTLYDLSDLDAIRTVTRRVWDGRGQWQHPPRRPQVFAGLAVVEPNPSTSAYDLRSEHLHRYWFPEHVHETEACAFVLTSPDVKAPIQLAPWSQPDQRFPSDVALEFDCSPPDLPQQRLISVQPDGPWVFGTRERHGFLFDASRDYIAYMHDFLANVQLRPAWLGGKMYFIQDYSTEEVQQDLRVVDPYLPTRVDTAIALPSGEAVLQIEATKTNVWALTESSTFGEGPRSLLGWRPGLVNTLLIRAPLPGGFRPSVMVTGTKHVYASNALDRLLAYDDQGQLSSDVELPEALEAGSLVASELGLFARGASGRLWWLPVGASALVPHQDPCSDLNLWSAHGDKIYGVSQSPGGRHFRSRPSLVEYRLRPGDNVFSLDPLRHTPVDHRISGLQGEQQQWLLGRTPVELHWPEDG